MNALKLFIRVIVFVCIYPKLNPPTSIEVLCVFTRTTVTDKTPKASTHPATFTQTVGAESTRSIQYYVCIVAQHFRYICRNIAKLQMLKYEEKRLKELG